MCLVGAQGCDITLPSLAEQRGASISVCACMLWANAVHCVLNEPDRRVKTELVYIVHNATFGQITSFIYVLKTGRL